MSIQLKNTNQNSASEYNIVVLGETGTGKSTTINALASYLKYGSFEEALAAPGEFINLIPTQFVLPHPETEEEFVIRHGTDPNECSGENNNSATQDPMGHVFKFKDMLIRVIDTPGLGDTKGIDTDKENFDKILQFLSNHKDLHGICVLIKANENRKKALFKYCINEMFTRLHKSACRNIVFCFTYSRITYYKPGEGFSLLRSFLQNDVDQLTLPLVGKGSEANCFFIDNEAYRCLLAKQKGYPLQDELIRSCKESWDKSAVQIQTMINRITRLEPHKLEQTILLNSAKDMLINMAEPLLLIQTNIERNIDIIEREEAKLRNSTESPEYLMRNLTLEVYELEKKELDYPTTVCTAERCVEVIDSDNGEATIRYKTRCHERCQLKGVKVNYVGHPILKDCYAMCLGASPNCDRNCGCPWEKHKHITWDYVRIKKQIITQRKIRNPQEDARKQLQGTLEDIRMTVEEYKAEKIIIQNISSKFAYILKTNSNTTYNKFIEPYLDLLIEEEQTKMNARINYPKTTFDSLIKMRTEHLRMVQILEDAVENGNNNKSTENVQIGDINKLRDKLLGLKHSGAQFAQMIESNIESKRREFKYRDNLGLDLS